MGWVQTEWDRSSVGAAWPEVVAVAVTSASAVLLRNNRRRPWIASATSPGHSPGRLFRRTATGDGGGGLVAAPAEQVGW